MTMKIIRLTLPIVIQNLLGAEVISVGTVMINYVGQSAVSAVSLAEHSVYDLLWHGERKGNRERRDDENLFDAAR